MTHSTRPEAGAAPASKGSSAPRRFYKAAAIGEAEGRYAVLLDGRPLRTPARRPLLVADRALAEAIRAEWDGQGSVIVPSSMPLTRLVNVALDGVSDRPAEVRRSIVDYAASDLVFYLADGPEALRARQETLWAPVRDWAERRLGALFATTTGVRPVAQPARSLELVAAYLDTRADALDLAALSVVTTLTGSALVALALAEGAITADHAWDAGEVDEAWNREEWGEDEEAKARTTARKAEFDAAAFALDRARMRGGATTG